MAAKNGNWSFAPKEVHDLWEENRKLFDQLAELEPMWSDLGDKKFTKSYYGRVGTKKELQRHNEQLRGYLETFKGVNVVSGRSQRLSGPIQDTAQPASRRG